jgi:hypothetical protein
MTVGDICNRDVIVAPRGEMIIDAAKRGGERSRPYQLPARQPRDDVRSGDRHGAGVD